MSGIVPHSVTPRAPGRRIAGSAFRLGGLALAVGPGVGPAPRTVTICRQRRGDLGPDGRAAARSRPRRLQPAPQRSAESGQSVGGSSGT